MNQHATEGRPLSLAVFCVLAALLGVAIALSPAGCRRGFNYRPSLAEDLNNIKQVKYALDGFATDHGGRYPCRETADEFGIAYRGFRPSNDYFRQLFLAEETASEKIFWSRNSPVASERPPDDVIETGGELDPAVILPPGDVHWAYVTEQTNTSNLLLPLLLDPFTPGTAAWDADRIDGKAVVLRIDGSAKAMRLDPKGQALDSNGDDIFAIRHHPESGAPVDPRRLLVQPAPRIP